MTASDYLSECYRRTGIVLTDAVSGRQIDRTAKEMALTYRMLGYGPAAASDFLRRYYLMEAHG